MATALGSIDLASLKNLRDDLTQYFWFESNASATYGAGAHITLVPDTTFISNPTGQNILMNTDGFSIRNGLLPMMTLDNDSLDFNIVDTTAGTYTTTATFTATGAQIGQSNGAHSVIDANGQRFYASNGATQLANIGYGVGAAQSSGSESTAPYYSFGTRLSLTDVNLYSANSTYAVGDVCKYNDKIYVCKTEITTGETWTSSHWSEAKIGTWSTAEGIKNVSMYLCHAEGSGNKILGNYNHGEGVGNVITTMSAGGNIGASHVEGWNNIVDAGYAHAEGNKCYASGSASHVEGQYSSAEGFASHAQNLGTVTRKTAQTAIGRYNKIDTSSPPGQQKYGTYAFIIGNGTSDDARSNAFTVTWEGNVNIPSGAHYKIGSANLKASDVGAVPLNGGAMTGQLLTSYKSSVAMGSYGSAQTTVGGLVGEVRYSSGCAGSANITTAYTADGVTISTGWYNFMYMPHRSGGKNGATDGDNVQYGNLLLFGMNNTNGRFVVRVSSGSIAEVVKLVTTADIATTTATPSIKTSTGTLVASSIARSGKLRTLFLRVKNSSAINAGSNVYVGTLSTTSDRPAVWANGVGYYGSAGIMFQLKDTGEITGRVIGAQLSANGEVYASLTYVVS